MALPFIFSHQNTILNSPPPLPCGVVKHIPQGKPSPIEGEENGDTTKLCKGGKIITRFWKSVFILFNIYDKLYFIIVRHKYCLM
jgi:hypothetical protein